MNIVNYHRIIKCSEVNRYDLILLFDVIYYLISVVLL